MNVHSFFCYLCGDKKIITDESNFLGNRKYSFSSFNARFRCLSFMEPEILPSNSALVFTVSSGRCLPLRNGGIAFGCGDIIFKSKIYEIRLIRNFCFDAYISAAPFRRCAPGSTGYREFHRGLYPFVFSVCLDLARLEIL